MSNHQRRLKEIEVKLTPHQVVLLWMKNELAHKYEEGILQSLRRPREAIANSVAQIVREGLKGQPDTLVERAVRQGQQEADWLYMIVVDVNHRIQMQTEAVRREYFSLLGWLAAAMDSSILSSVSRDVLEAVAKFHESLSMSAESLRTMRSILPSSPEEPLRAVTLAFIQRILLLDAAVSRVSAERFGSHPILFSDSAANLTEQLEFVDEVLASFNSLARQARLQPLSKEQISDGLVSNIEQQVSHWSMLARGGMLAVFGEWCEFKAAFRQLAASYSWRETPDGSE